MERGEACCLLNTQWDVAWNHPWYERHGFIVVAPEAWTTAMTEMRERRPSSSRLLGRELGEVDVPIGPAGPGPPRWPVQADTRPSSGFGQLGGDFTRSPGARRRREANTSANE